MQRLWAPWRINYIRSEKKNKKCIFCQDAQNRKKNYVVFKTDYSIVLLNIFPYNNGHLMVAPIRHVRDISLLKDEEALDLFRSLKKAKTLLEKVLRPDGYNIGINLSESAGAGIVGHLHIHIVPRWRGDTNFMPVISKTKVISQSLEELHKRLKYAYAKTT
jgi:ATP adenylyltransferase